MSCDPTWEVCDTPADKPAATASKSDSDLVLDDEVVIEGNDLFVAHARAWALLSSGLFWQSYQGYVSYINTVYSSSSWTGYTDAQKDTYTGVNVWKYLKYSVYLGQLWGLVGSLVWFPNVFLGGKGGPAMQAAVLLSKLSGLVGIIQIVLAVLWFLAIPDQADATASTYEAVI